METAERVIVLGMDGLSPVIVDAMLERGELPGFARLRERGAYRHLATSNPSQSPVAWTTMATGCNAGRHGVFDFLRRNPRKYLPELGILRVNPRNVLGRRESMFLPVRQAPAFWNIASDAGVPSTVIRWPLTLPPDPINGRMLAGLGVPDLSANLGRYTRLTTRKLSAEEAAASKGVVVQLKPGSDSQRVRIAGPDRSQLPARLAIDRQARTVTLKVAGQDIVLAEKQWSGFVRLPFKVMLVRTVHALVTFYVASVEPEVDVYMTALQVDPRQPAFPFTHPDGYGAELAEAVGDYHTLGMPEDTNALGDGVLDADAFLEQCDACTAERERMLWHELNRFDRGLLAFVFDTTDRIQHAFWGTRDPEHPAYDADFAARYGSVIEDAYRRMDTLLGRVLDTIDERTALLVVSDHGFTTFRRAVHVNSWLIENGYMALTNSDREATLFRNVDWARTRAYAVGFSSVFLNLAGREGKGIVPAEEAAALRSEIAGRLAEMTDPDTGEAVMERAYTRDELYSGPCIGDAPDVVLGFRPGYRTSWQTAAGGVPAALVEDNCESWCGDHLVDPASVPGVLFLNRPTAVEAPAIGQVAPTVLQLLGVPAPPEMEAQGLLA